MSEPLQDYKQLLELAKEIQTLESVMMLLGWDQDVMMPKEGVEFRSYQKQLIAALIHQRQTSDEYKKALQKFVDLKTGELCNVDKLEYEQQASVRDWHKEFSIQNKQPEKFVREFTETVAQTTSAWEEAKKESNFSKFAPHLEKIVTLSKQKAEYIGYADHPYDSLLDLYEPGMTSKTLDKVFGDLKPTLIKLVKDLSNASISNDFLNGEYPSEQAIDFCKPLLESMHFSSKRSRIDTSTHPFCLGLHPTDVRFTTHSNSSDFIRGQLSAMLHEAGHGLYEMQLPSEDYGSASSKFCSIGIHESQSKLWEVFIGLSEPFWEPLFPAVQKNVQKLANVSFQDFYKGINKVTPSFIRIHADEVSYSVHVILRYEIEKGLIEGSIKVSDIPEIWNTKMKQYLGICPKDNAEGCLQDVHWGAGFIGYFPTYVLGNLYAACFVKALKKEFPDWENKLRQGHLGFISDWLKSNIHCHGRVYLPQDLLKKVTGSEFSSEPFKEYLNQKFLPLLQ